MAGGKVVLSEGEFAIAVSIVPVDSLTLEGQGASSVLFAVASLDDDVIGTPASGTLEDAKLRHFKIDGNRSNNASGNGIYLYSPRYCVIEYVTITNADDHSISLDGAGSPDQGFYNWIHHNHINLCDERGISVSSTEFNWIMENIVRFVTGDGIFAESGNDLIKNNILDSVTGDSIRVEFGSGKWTITGNDIDRPAGAAIMMRRNDFGVVSYNRIANLEQDQIGIGNGEFDSGEDNGDDMLVDHNQISIKSGATGTIGIQEPHETADCIYENNQLVGLATPMALHASSTGGQVRNNKGYVTETSGTATLLNASTAIVVTHGLGVTPAAGDIMVTPMESLGAAAEFYIDTYTSTQFTIHVNVDPTQDVDFAWKAVVL